MVIDFKSTEKDGNEDTEEIFYLKIKKAYYASMDLPNKEKLLDEIALFILGKGFIDKTDVDLLQSIIFNDGKVSRFEANFSPCTVRFFQSLNMLIFKRIFLTTRSVCDKTFVQGFDSSRLHPNLTIQSEFCFC